MTWLNGCGCIFCISEHNSQALGEVLREVLGKSWRRVFAVASSYSDSVYVSPKLPVVLIQNSKFKMFWFLFIPTGDFSPRLLGANFLMLSLFPMQ